MTLLPLFIISPINPIAESSLTLNLLLRTRRSPLGRPSSPSQWNNFPPQNKAATTNPKTSSCSDPTPGLEILSSSPDSSSSPDHALSGSPTGTSLLCSDPNTVSNNGSCCSGEEDPKEAPKTTATRPPPETSHIAVSGLDHDRREKIRLKNEKKHARQRERRAQELHDRCCGFLMSRKLESLSQQIVAMGFSKDRATMALMLNEGKVEESVNWLFEGNDNDSEGAAAGAEKQIQG